MSARELELVARVHFKCPKCGVVHYDEDALEEEEGTGSQFCPACGQWVYIDYEKYDRFITYLNQMDLS